MRFKGLRRDRCSYRCVLRCSLTEINHQCPWTTYLLPTTHCVHLNRYTISEKISNNKCIVNCHALCVLKIWCIYIFIYSVKISNVFMFCCLQAEKIIFAPSFFSITEAINFRPIFWCNLQKLRHSKELTVVLCVLKYGLDGLLFFQGWRVFHW